MAWIAPKIDYAVKYVPTPTDLNRIEGNTKYLREENKTINGTNTFTGSTTMQDLNCQDMTTTSGNTSWLMSQNGNAGRVLLAGGDTAAVVDGAYIVIEGRNYLGSGLGGNIDLQAFTGKSINCNSPLNPTTTPTKGVWALTSTPFVIPRGRYNIATTNFGSNHVEAEMLCSDGVWRDIYNGQEGPTISGSGRGFWVESSGADVRIFQIGGGTIDTFYNKY